MTVHLEIPDDLLRSLVPEGQDPARAILEDFAAEQYRRQRLTLNQVKSLLGFGTRMQADEFLGSRKTHTFTIDDFDQDLKRIAAFEAERLAANTETGHRSK